MEMKYHLYGTNITSDLELDAPMFKRESQLKITEGTFETPKTFKTKIYRADCRAEIYINSAFVILHWPGMVTFKIDKNTIIYQKLDSSLDEGLLRIFITSEALGIYLFLNGSFMLHGGAVMIKNKAHVFLGKPGAGKSTTVAAFAKAGFEIMADDMVVIKLNAQNQPEVHWGGNSIKIWDKTAEGLEIDIKKLTPAWEGKNKFIFETKNHSNFEPKALKSIVVLNAPNTRKNLGNLPLIMSPTLLLQYFPLAHQLLKDENLKRHFENSILIAQNCIISQIKRPKNFNKLEQYIKTFL
jgi:hypothetical protein